MRTYDDLGKLLLRITLGVIVLFHGIYKLRHGVAWIEQPLAEGGPGGAELFDRRTSGSGGAQ